MPPVRTGLLLLNLGTPASADASDVRPYLREFLTDGRVIDIPGPLRWLLVNGVIAPFRAPKSAEAYKTIWTDEGSPLLVHSRALERAVRARLDEDATAAGTPPVVVELAMRYGQPDIAGALERMRQAGVERIVALPLYPQYSSAATGSSIERVMELASQGPAVPPLSFVPAFYDHPAFLDAVVAASAASYEVARADHVLFSFHGLPEAHVQATDPSGSHCLRREGCCDSIVADNRFCYRAQCFATARGLAARLGLSAAHYSVSFQSRLGRAEWVKPYTDDVLPTLAKQGKRRLAVFCPAFVADCLETLEEIGVRAREDFVNAGGEDLFLMPCPNAHPRFVAAVLDLCRETSTWLPPPAEAPPRESGIPAAVV
ncbi:MAG: ferrochelatase [Myxococcota bacterium]